MLPFSRRLSFSSYYSILTYYPTRFISHFYPFRAIMTSDRYPKLRIAYPAVNTSIPLPDQASRGTVRGRRYLPSTTVASAIYRRRRPCTTSLQHLRLCKSLHSIVRDSTNSNHHSINSRRNSRPHSWRGLWAQVWALHNNIFRHYRQCQASWVITQRRHRHHPLQRWEVLGLGESLGLGLAWTENNNKYNNFQIARR